MQTDVTHCDQVRHLVDTAVRAHGRIDVIINNAGLMPHSPLERGKVADWDRMIKVHLYGTFHGTRAALRHMTPARSGSIVNVSSVLGLAPMAGNVHYSTAKAGIIAVTKSVGHEVAPFGIRVNAVCPGFIDTPLLAPIDPMLMAGILMQIPKGRLGTAQEIAELVRFLAGPESGYCNGDIFAASGGYV